jgi:hypothetical protein
MFEIDEKARFDVFVCFVDQHAPLHEEWLKPFEHDIDHRFEQGMTGRNEFGLRLTGERLGLTTRERGDLLQRAALRFKHAPLRAGAR